MPIINGVKYACEPCMRGHRSSKCTHDDRLLVRVRKPGRPLSSCPHLPSGPAGTTFVDANGARLDGGTASHSSLPGRPCGCEVTSLAIPKVSSCACSLSRCIHPPASLPPVVKSRSNTPLLISRASSQKSNGPKSQSVSPPVSPITSGSLYSTTAESVNGRLSKVAKKRKSVSINGESLLELANKQNGVETPTVTTEPEKIKITESSPLELFNGRSDRANNDTTLNPARRGNEPKGEMQKNGAIVRDTPGSSFHMGPEPITWTDGYGWQQHLSMPQTVQETVVRSPILDSNLNRQQQKPCCGGCVSKAPAFSSSPPNQLPQNIILNQSFPNFHTPSFPFATNTQYSSTPAPMQQMQPIATTIYTYPNGYTTVNNPLTPQELTMLQAMGLWRSPAAAAAWAGRGAGGPLDLNPEYACQCGSGCECLGCAAHPFNTSTVNFVKDMRDMMHSNRFSGSAGSISREQNTAKQNGGGNNAANANINGSNLSHDDARAMEYKAQHSQQTSERTAPSLSLQQMPYQYHSSPRSRASNSPFSHHATVPSPLEHSQTTQAQVRPHHGSPALPSNARSPTYTSASSPDLNPGDEDGDTDQNTVSPSAFFHIDYPLGLCSESGMGCMCDEDCTCFGCLTHGNTVESFESQFNTAARTGEDSSHNEEYRGNGVLREGVEAQAFGSTGSRGKENAKRELSVGDMNGKRAGSNGSNSPQSNHQHITQLQNVAQFQIHPGGASLPPQGMIDTSGYVWA